MQVRATAKGFFGQMIEAGQVFTVPDGTKGTWFVPLPKGEAGDTAGPKAGKTSTTTTQVEVLARAAAKK